MPCNVILINGTIEYEVPDSWMPTLMEYLKLVADKTKEEE